MQSSSPTLSSSTINEKRRRDNDDDSSALDMLAQAADKRRRVDGTPSADSSSSSSSSSAKPKTKSKTKKKEIARAEEKKEEKVEQGTSMKTVILEEKVKNEINTILSAIKTTSEESKDLLEEAKKGNLDAISDVLLSLSSGTHGIYINAPQAKNIFNILHTLKPVVPVVAALALLSRAAQGLPIKRGSVGRRLLYQGQFKAWCVFHENPLDPTPIWTSSTVTELEEEAKRDNKFANYALGLFYADTLSDERLNQLSLKRYETVKYYFDKATALGLIDAELMLGIVLSKKQNNRRANDVALADCFNKLKKHALAIFCLGKYYSNNDYLKAAANQGFELAQGPHTLETSSSPIEGDGYEGATVLSSTSSSSSSSATPFILPVIPFILSSSSSSITSSLSSTPPVVLTSSSVSFTTSSLSSTPVVAPNSSSSSSLAASLSSIPLDVSSSSSSSIPVSLSSTPSTTPSSSSIPVSLSSTPSTTPSSLNLGALLSSPIDVKNLPLPPSYAVSDISQGVDLDLPKDVEHQAWLAPTPEHTEKLNNLLMDISVPSTSRWLKERIFKGYAGNVSCQLQVAYCLVLGMEGLSQHKEKASELFFHINHSVAFHLYASLSADSVKLFQLAEPKIKLMADSEELICKGIREQKGVFILESALKNNDPIGVYSLKAGVQKNDVHAMCGYGTFLFKTAKTKADKDNAVDYIKKMAMQDQVPAQKVLTLMFREMNNEPEMKVWEEIYTCALNQTPVQSSAALSQLFQNAEMYPKSSAGFRYAVECIVTNKYAEEDKRATTIAEILENSNNVASIMLLGSCFYLGVGGVPRLPITAMVIWAGILPSVKNSASQAMLRYNLYFAAKELKQLNRAEYFRKNACAVNKFENVEYLREAIANYSASASLSSSSSLSLASTSTFFSSSSLPSVSSDTVSSSLSSLRLPTLSI